MKRVTVLTDLDQFRLDNLDNNDDPIGEIILTTKSPKELVEEIYVFKEQLQSAKEENRKLLEQLSRGGVGLNSFEFLLKKDTTTTTKRRSGGTSFFMKRFSGGNNNPDHTDKDFEIAEAAAEASDLLSSLQCKAFK